MIFALLEFTSSIHELLKEDMQRVQTVLQTYFRGSLILCHSVKRYDQIKYFQTQMEARSLMYRLKYNGLKIQPWRTPL